MWGIGKSNLIRNKYAYRMEQNCNGSGYPFQIPYSNFCLVRLVNTNTIWTGLMISTICWNVSHGSIISNKSKTKIILYSNYHYSCSCIEFQILCGKYFIGLNKWKSLFIRIRISIAIYIYIYIYIVLIIL